MADEKYVIEGRFNTTVAGIYSRIDDQRKESQSNLERARRESEVRVDRLYSDFSKLHDDFPTRIAEVKSYIHDETGSLRRFAMRSFLTFAGGLVGVILAFAYYAINQHAYLSEGQSVIERQQAVNAVHIKSLTDNLTKLATKDDN